MAQARGSAAQIVIDFETTYGSDPVAPAGILMPFNPPFGLKADQNMTIPQTIRGVRDATEPIFGNRDVRGSISVPVDLIAIGYWLRALLGSPATNQSVAPYVHIFKPASSIPSLVVDVGHTDITQFLKYNGVKVDSMALDFSGDGEIVAAMDLIGANVAASGTAYDATPTSLTFTRLSMPQVTLEEGGGALSNAKIINLSIKNSLDPDSFVIGGGGIRGALPEGTCTVTGKVTAMFENLTLYNKALNNTESSLEVIMTSGSYSLSILVPELKYKLTSPVVQTQGGVYVELEFSGYYENGADAACLKVTLVNTHSAYA